jgi:hypothetical protein
MAQLGQAVAWPPVSLEAYTGGMWKRAKGLCVAEEGCVAVFALSGRAARGMIRWRHRRARTITSTTTLQASSGRSGPMYAGSQDQICQGRVRLHGSEMDGEQQHHSVGRLH